ncbi:MAG: Fic family protein [Desulfobulbaceae bacterium]|nr:Fic family protein [Desulfobulbaceae bacterium]
MKTRQWIWQNPDWPKFTYSITELLPRLTSVNRLVGALEMTSRALAGEELLDAREKVLTDDVVETSAIEGEILRRSSVRASIRKQLGLPITQDDSDRHTDALVEMLLDARKCAASPLTEQKLFSWHAALFPTGYSGMHKIRVGKYRGAEQMKIVSGPVNREKVHYIAPPENRIENDMNRLLAYINKKSEPDPLLKAGIAHLRFIMIHPFDDGNGRIARAITDYILAAEYCHLMQIVTLSKQISLDRKGYYSTLEKAGKNGLDITPWLSWFLETVFKALHESRWTIDRIMQKVQFWKKHRDTLLNARQHKVLNRLLDSGEKFEGGMTTRKYAGMTKCSKVTASRDLSDLEEKKILRKRPGGGRSTSYEIAL